MPPGFVWFNNYANVSDITKVGAAEIDVGFEWGTFWDPPAVSDKIYSAHSGGNNVSFCDGHVDAISDSTENLVRDYEYQNIQ